MRALEEWKKQVEDYRKSGMRQNDWCAAQGIPKGTFQYRLNCFSALTACHKVIQDQMHSDSLSIALFPMNKKEQTTFVSDLFLTVDCLVSIERVGRAKDGTYRTMRALDITAKTAPLDDLFIYAQTHPEMHITTVSIGDGGNEIGMGHKINEVQNYIPNGEIIACVVPSDHLIVTGVSNWGGYALAGALQCLSCSPVFASNEEQFQMLEKMIEANCCDGVLAKPVLSVDGLPWPVHSKILDEIRSILLNRVPHFEKWRKWKGCIDVLRSKDEKREVR